MKAFIVIALLLILFLVFVTNVYSNVDLTPNTPAVASAATPTLWSPLPTVTVPPANASQPQVSVPVTGGCVLTANGTCANTGVVPGTVYYQPAPAVVGVPVTGAVAVPVTGVVAIPVTGAVCPNPYTVTYGDTLSLIALRCGTTVPALLTLNPNLFNPDLIFPGQVLWVYPVTGSVIGVPVTGAVVVPAAPVIVPTPAPATPVIVQPSVSPLPAGATVTVKILKFPPNTPVNIGVGKVGMGYQVVNQGITDANGTLQATVPLPANFNPNDQWTVIAVTTNGPITQAASLPFKIGQ